MAGSFHLSKSPACYACACRCTSWVSLRISAVLRVLHLPGYSPRIPTSVPNLKWAGHFGYNCFAGWCLADFLCRRPDGGLRSEIEVLQISLISTTRERCNQRSIGAAKTIAAYSKKQASNIKTTARTYSPSSCAELYNVYAGPHAKAAPPESSSSVARKIPVSECT